jgi:hypothetical protein
MDHFDARGRRLDDPEDEGPSHCPDCGIHYGEVGPDGVMRWEGPAVAVNPVTGCLCRPEDFEREPAGPGDLGGIPF